MMVGSCHLLKEEVKCFSSWKSQAWGKVREVNTRLTWCLDTLEGLHQPLYSLGFGPEWGRSTQPQEPQMRLRQNLERLSWSFTSTPCSVWCWGNMVPFQKYFWNGCEVSRQMDLCLHTSSLWPWCVWRGTRVFFMPWVRGSRNAGRTQGPDRVCIWNKTKSLHRDLTMRGYSRNIGSSSMKKQPKNQIGPIATHWAQALYA